MKAQAVMLGSLVIGVGFFQVSTDPLQKYFGITSN